MSFPVNSTSVQSPGIARLNRVIGRSKAGKLVAFAAVFVCKVTAGTTLFSAHAFGKASDLMLKVDTRENAERLARAVVVHATKPTVANLGRPLKSITFVIGGDRQFNRVSPKKFEESHYDGIAHDNHVHAAEMGSTTVRPPCAR